MRVRFKGEDPGDRVCVVGGQTFPQGEWVATENRKLANNPMFDVREAEAVPAAPAEPAEDPEHELDDTVEDLRAQLTALGVEFHPRAGVKKLTELLEAATAPPATEEEGA